MNGNMAALAEAEKIALHAKQSKETVNTALCVPAIFVSSFAQKLDLAIGGQDCHHKENGAFTGDVSASMLQEAGATYVIVGHSERREGHNESSDIISQKAEIAHKNGLISIICVGESLECYENKQSADFVKTQVRDSLPASANAQNTIIAYEPIWAIGTGLTPTSDEIADIHQKIYNVLIEEKGQKIADGMHILYGGSVKASNAAEIAAINHVHGALVGGASLTAEQFCPIIDAFAAEQHNISAVAS